MSLAIQEKSEESKEYMIDRLPLYNEIPGRNHYICPYECKCFNLRKCCKFKPYKKLCTSESYICTKLLKNDVLGFCAAGLCLKYNNKFLFLKELRDNCYKYNFPGGGRETIILPSGEKRPEKYYETVSSEFMEEMENLVENGKNNPYIIEISKMILNNDSNVYWSGDSKYCLIFLEISENLALKIKPENDNNDINKNIFTWIDRKDFTRDIFHSYAYKYIRDIFGKNY